MDCLGLGLYVIPFTSYSACIVFPKENAYSNRLELLDLTSLYTMGDVCTCVCVCVSLCVLVWLRA